MPKTIKQKKLNLKEKKNGVRRFGADLTSEKWD